MPNSIGDEPGAQGHPKVGAKTHVGLKQIGSPFQRGQGSLLNNVMPFPLLPHAQGLILTLHPKPTSKGLNGKMSTDFRTRWIRLYWICQVWPPLGVLKMERLQIQTHSCICRYLEAHGSTNVRTALTIASQSDSICHCDHII